MNPVERLVAFLWDPHGEQRQAQRLRVQHTLARIRINARARRKLRAEIKRTQDHIERLRGQA